MIMVPVEDTEDTGTVLLSDETRGRFCCPAVVLDRKTAEPSPCLRVSFLKDKKLEADFILLLEKYIFYSVLQGSTPTFDTEPFYVSKSFIYPLLRRSFVQS